MCEFSSAFHTLHDLIIRHHNTCMFYCPVIFYLILLPPYSQSDSKCVGILLFVRLCRLFSVTELLENITRLNLFLIMIIKGLKR